MKARIHVVGGPAAGRVVDLDEGTLVVVGRGTDVQLSIPADTALSRKHLELELPMGSSKVTARDLGSKHGMFVNGARETTRELASGERVQVGDTILRMEIYDPIAATLPAGSIAASGLAQSVRCRCGALSSEVAKSGDDVVFLCVRCHEELELTPVLPDGFELVRMLGRGAMGCVYLARTDAGDLRAVKQILPKAAMSGQMRKMFLREASVQSALQHANIVRVHGLAEPLPGSFAIVMEFVDGDSADKLIENGHTVDPALAVAIGCQALDGLAHAHGKNIVHRDIKEANLMLVRGATPVVKIADFGLAKNFHESGASGMTQDGALGGTLAYMSREQLLDYKYVKPPADVYALGATLYRLLTGEYPRDYRDGENWVLVSLERPIVPIRQRAKGRNLPPGLCTVIERALAPELTDRYPSAAEMRRALAATAT
nr:FHA domain-containing serine/threonine-protein kinase [Kofleriaceae bacterium]